MIAQFKFTIRSYMYTKWIFISSKKNRGTQHAVKTFAWISLSLQRRPSLKTCSTSEGTLCWCTTSLAAVLILCVAVRIRVERRRPCRCLRPTTTTSTSVEPSEPSVLPLDSVKQVPPLPFFFFCIPCFSICILYAKRNADPLSKLEFMFSRLDGSVLQGLHDHLVRTQLIFSQVYTVNPVMMCMILDNTEIQRHESPMHPKPCYSTKLVSLRYAPNETICFLAIFCLLSLIS